jgi:amphi-Trp domain-containing protein
MDILKISDKQSVRREEAARQLREIADELSSGNGFVVQRGDVTVTVAVPDTVTLKIEVDIESDEREIEIEITW